MSKRVAAVLIGVPLVCALELLGLAVAVKVGVDRRAERRVAEEERRQAEAEQAREREVAYQEMARSLERSVRELQEVVFTDPKAPTAEEAAEFSELFAALAKALDTDDGAALVRRLDPERLFDELLRTGQLNKLGLRFGRPDREGFARRVREGRARDFFNPSFRWQSVDVRRVRWSADRNEAVVIASHASDAGPIGRVKQKVRWWLVRRPDGWRVYDFEDLNHGLRATQVMGATLTPDLPARLPALRAAVLAIWDAQAAVAKLDLAAAEAALNGCRTDDLPDPLAAVVHAFRAGIHLERAEPNTALECIDRAARLQPDMPLIHLLRAHCHVLAGEHAKVLPAVDAYTVQLGPDDDAEVLRGVALEGLNRPDEARAAYRRAGDLDPDAPAPLLGLCRVLDPKGAQEIGDRLGRATNPSRLYAAVRRGTAPGRNAAVDDALLDGLRKARPDDPLGLAEDVRRQVAAGRFDAALELMERGLKAPVRAQAQVLGAYLFAMCRAKKWQDAYAAVPAAHADRAFRSLADYLDDTAFGVGGDGPGAAAAELRYLVAAHRKRAPDDPWLWYYEGAALQYEREYDKAEAAFAAGADKLPAPEAATDPDEPDEPEERADAVRQFRWRRVACLLQARRGMEAYEKIGPVAEVFQQLAASYDRINDLDGLKGLLAAHRKREPKDVQLLYWEAHLKFRTREYAAAAPLFKKFLAAADDKTPNGREARDGYLRAVLRSKPADAPAVLAELRPERVAPALRAAVAASAGARDELERLIAEATRGGRPLWFYADEDFRQAFGQKRWADLRAKYPDPVPPPKEEL